MNPQLTIVIPVHNRAESVVSTLDSIGAGTVLPQRLLIVDNGSTDQTLERCRAWAESRQHAGFIVTVLSEPRKGAAIARNTGLKACTTDYVYFFDSDDLFDVQAVADIMHALEEQETDLLFLPVQQEWNVKTQTRPFQENASPHIHILNSMFSTVCMVFRTAWLREIGGWDEALTTWDDWELGVRATLHHPRVCWLTRHPYHHIIIHPDSITGANFTQTLDHILLAMRHAINDVQLAPLAPQQRALALRALFFRSHIMAGNLRQENNEKGAAAFRQLTLECLPHPAKPLKSLGLLLEHYTALGGRGAWKIALALCR